MSDFITQDDFQNLRNEELESQEHIKQLENKLKINYTITIFSVLFSIIQTIVLMY